MARSWFSLLCCSPAFALDNGAALTPPMGWSTWNKLKCQFSAETLLAVADAMVKSGMVKAGYSTLNMDDCWPRRGNRDSDGSIIPDPSKFPNGMRNFSDALRSKGLGLGIYTAHGSTTCQGFPGSLGHEEKDAASYASWNVVFVKNDWCWHNEPSAQAHFDAFAAMRDALNRTGKRMVHSAHWNYRDLPGPGCAAGQDCPLPTLANMWRIGQDIGPNWGSVLRLIDADIGHAAAASPGAWNDADMLEVGNGMSPDQDRAHFTLWCMLSSPLIAGNDVRTMSATTRSILTNKWAIEVNQDPLGKQAKPLNLSGRSDGNVSSTQVWTKPLRNPTGAIAVALLNRGDSNANIELDFSDLHGASHYEVLDLWNDGASLGVKQSLSVKVPPTAAEMFKMIPRSPAHAVLFV